MHSTTGVIAYPQSKYRKHKKNRIREAEKERQITITQVLQLHEFIVCNVPNVNNNISILKSMTSDVVLLLPALLILLSYYLHREHLRHRRSKHCHLHHARR